MKPKFRSVVVGVALIMALATGMTLIGAIVGTDAPASSPPKVQFTVTGWSYGVYPGGTQALNVDVRNDNAFAISVTHLHVVVGSPKPKCPATDLVVPDYSGTFHVGRQSQARLAMSVRMQPGVASECQRATYPLAFSGMAVKA